MFDFVEQPVLVRDSEYPMLRKHPSRVVMQTGLQPVAFVQEDVKMQERPVSLLNYLYRKSQSKSKRTG